MKKEYAIGTYEINLLYRDELKMIFNQMQSFCKWVDTAIDYDNDYVLPAVLNADTKIISKISSYHNDDYEFFVSNHLKFLRRDKIDLMLIHSNRGDWKPVAQKMQNDKRFDKIGVSNFTAKDISDYHELTGNWPYANEVEINPFYTDIEAINFCKEHGIKIISYAILGGKYNSWRNVAHYGLGNLIAYAQQFADIVICRANSVTEALHFASVCTDYDFDSAAPIKIETEAKKAIEPMVYTSPAVYNTMYGKPTYLREIAKNADDGFYKIESRLVDEIKLPEFEMLGDVKTYIRYKYGSDSYFGDWLSIGNRKYIAVYLWDKNHKLTKVVPDAVNIEIWEYTITGN